MNNENSLNDLREHVPPSVIDPGLPRIYSSVVILCFSILFAPIFGGVLLALNLFRTDRKREGIGVLLLSILYEAVVLWLVNLPEEPMTSLTYLLNIAGGAILAKAVFPNYFPEERVFPKRKIWAPLIVSILITVPFLLAMIADI